MPELIAELQALVAERPLQERPRAMLMRALYRAGRQPEALEVFRDGRRVLDEQLGLEPGPGLREVERAILRQDPALVAAVVQPTAEQAGLTGTVVAVAERESGLDALSSLAEALATRPRERGLVLARVVPAGELTAATAQLDETRRRLVAAGTARVRVAAFSSASPGDDVVRLAALQDADLLLLSAAGDPLAGPFASVLAGATCDVASLVEGGGGIAAGPVVVPFGAFEHDWSALELGAWAATALDRPLQLIGAAEGARGRDASRLLADASLVVQHTAGVVAEPMLGRTGREGVAALADGAALLVLGLSDRWRSEGLGATRAALVADPVAPTVLVRRGLRPGGIAPPTTLTRFTWSIERSRI